MDKEILSRLERIEARLDRVERALNIHAHNTKDESQGEGQANFAGIAPRGPDRKAWSGGDWLHRLGIGLLLFGVAFLFKYSIDQGWLTPWVRIWIGAATGVGLLALACRLLKKRPLLGRTLAGGGLASLYITIFAAFQLYQLIPFALAFVGMVGLTLAGFLLSVRIFGAALALISALGGYATPFVLYTGEEDLIGLLAYGWMITAAGTLIYLRQSWRSLLAVNFLGAWAIMLAAYVSAGFRHEVPPDPEPLQILRYGLIAYWALFLSLPAAALWLKARTEAALFGVILSTGVVGAAFAEHLWFLSERHWSLVWFLAGAFYASLALGFQRWSSGISQSYGLTAAVLISIGLWHLLSQNAFLFALGLEGLGMLHLGLRFEARSLTRLGHLLLACVGFLLLMRLIAAPAFSPALINGQALLWLGNIFVFGIAAWKFAPEARWIYGVSTHLLLMLWFRHDLHNLTNGEAYVSLAWGLQGAALLVLAFRLGHSGLRKLAMGTLFVVVLKVFLVDLSAIAAVWRILITLVLGCVFLLLSYYLSGKEQTPKGPKIAA